MSRYFFYQLGDISVYRKQLKAIGFFFLFFPAHTIILYLCIDTRLYSVQTLRVH